MKREPPLVGSCSTKGCPDRVVGWSFDVETRTAVRTCGPCGRALSEKAQAHLEKLLAAAIIAAAPKPWETPR